MMSDRGSAKPTGVVLVEDHVYFRQAMTMMLDLEQDFAVVAEAGSVAEARELSKQSLQDVDIAIVDLALPDGNGVDVIEDLRRLNPNLTVLVLSATLDHNNIARAVDAGAAGVLAKLAGLDEFVQEARRLRAGAAMPRQKEVVEMLLTNVFHSGQDHEARLDARLTTRETEVLRALVEGFDGEEVAERLGITLEEERNHVARILEKLGARSRLQALAIAARQGLVETP
jgi:two-component system nitrate/nitrite response regulator NarL